MPEWFKKRLEIRQAFPSPYRQTEDELAMVVAEAMKNLDALKQEKGGPAYLGAGPFNPLGPPYEKARDAELAPEMVKPVNEALDEAIAASIDLFKGLPNWNYPLAMPNIG